MISAKANADRALDVLETDAFSPDLLDALTGLSSADKTDLLENELLRTLVRTGDARIRNAVAVALADLKSEIAPSVIRDLIVSSCSAGSRATLLYALRELGGRLRLPAIVHLLAVEAGETQEEILNFIDLGLVEDPPNSTRTRAVECLKEIC